MSAAGDGAMRLDKALWYLRLARTRGIAQAMIAAGHIRLDGRRVDRASANVREGSLIVLPGLPRVRVLRIVSLPLRRGPPAEASACYVDMGSEEGALPQGPA
jgi:ribosome-associated heat shock protein Hsp15